MVDNPLADLDLDLDLGISLDSFDLSSFPDIQTLVAELETLSSEHTVLKSVIEKAKTAQNASMTVEQIAVLTYLIKEVRPLLTIETALMDGLASATTLAMHDINATNAGHVPIQPHDVEDKSGRDYIQSLGFQNYQLMEHEAEIVLPQIYLQNIAGDLKLTYLNSRGSYEDMLVAFYYLDKMLLSEGIFVLNTKDNPAIKELAEYIEKSRSSYTCQKLDCDIVLFQKKSVQ